MKTQMTLLAALVISIATACAQATGQGAELATPAQPAKQLQPDPAPLQLPVLSPEEVEKLIGGSTLVSVDLPQTDAKTLLQKYSEITGTPFKSSPNLWNGDWPQFAVKIKDAPFWEAVRLTATKAPFSIDISYPNKLFVMGNQRGLAAPWMGGPAQQSGPFTIVASRITRNRGVLVLLGPKTQPEVSEYLAAYLNLLIDPKLAGSGTGLGPALLGNSFEVSWKQAVDNNGQTIPIPRSANLSLREGLLGSFVVTFSTFDKSATSIARLEGQISALITAKTEKWEIPVADKAGAEATHTFQTPQGPITYKVALRQQGGVYVLSVSHAPGAKNPEPARSLYPITTIFPGTSEGIRVLDDAGQALRRGAASGDPDGWQITFSRQNMDDVIAPAKIVIDVPVSMVKVVIPFQFNDLPLP